MHPVFSLDGRELFFFDGEGISALTVEYEPNFRWGEPRALFPGPYWYGVGGPDGAFGRAWDWDPVGERFLMIEMPDGGEASTDPVPAGFQINVVLNWTRGLLELVPVD